MTERKYLDVEDLDVYQKLRQLHIEVSALTQQRPTEEKSIVVEAKQEKPSTTFS